MGLLVACGGQSASLAQSSQHPSDADQHDDENSDGYAETVELSAVDLTAGEKLKVVATTNIVGDLVDNVGGDIIELTTMLPLGVDPHTFDPTPQDITAVAEAQVIFINGLHLEEFLEKLIKNAGSEAPVVILSTDVQIREFDEMEDDHYKEENDHPHEGIDPHVWMAPPNVIVMVDNIEYALGQLDPTNTESYETNAAAYEAELVALDDWVMAKIENISPENRKMITDHDAFGYYTNRYGLDLVGTVIPAYSTNTKPSALELAELQEVIGNLGAKAIFVGTTVNPVLAKRMAEDTGVELIPLYTGSLGKAGSGAETYLDFIRYNTLAIVEALK